VTKVYDPVREKQLLEESWGWRRCQNRDFDEVKAIGGVGSSAVSYVDVGIECLLVGLDEPAFKVLARAEQWVRWAIAAQEKPQRYAADFTEAQWFEALAMCVWILYERQDEESWAHYLEHENRHLWGSDPSALKLNASYVLVSYVDAGAYEDALAIHKGVQKFSVPKSLKGHMEEPGMAYVLCRHRLGLEYEAEDVDKALGRFLRHHLNYWLVNGHFSRVARWLKIAHWNGRPNPPSPKEVLLKCYDYLPSAPSSAQP
jgi:hypothetical protein